MPHCLPLRGIGLTKIVTFWFESTFRNRLYRNG